MKSDDHFPLLDVIRLTAALLVLFGHARGVLVVGINDVPEPSLFTRAFYFVSALQNEGVVLFFVISGFLVGGSMCRQMAAGRFSLLHYLINRFARIYLVLIPALILTGIVTAIGFGLLGDTRLYAERPLVPSGVHTNWSWGQIPCHLLCLQAVACAPWGANPPLWSLGFEWTFYLLAVPLFAALLLPMKWAVRLPLAAAVLLLIWWLYRRDWGFALWLSYWLIGVVAADVQRRSDFPLVAGLAGVALCMAAMIASRLKIVPLELTNIATAATFGLALSCRTLVRRPLRSAAVDRGARFSYSLYLIHLPLCIFFGAMMERLLGWPPALVQPDWRAMLAFVLMVAFALTSAWLFALATEDRTAALRRRLQRLLLRDRESARQAPGAR